PGRRGRAGPRGGRIQGPPGREAGGRVGDAVLPLPRRGPTGPGQRLPVPAQRGGRPHPVGHVRHHHRQPHHLHAHPRRPIPSPTPPAPAPPTPPSRLPAAAIPRQSCLPPPPPVRPWAPPNPRAHHPAPPVQPSDRQHPHPP